MLCFLSTYENKKGYIYIYTGPQSFELFLVKTTIPHTPICRVPRKKIKIIIIVVSTDINLFDFDKRHFQRISDGSIFGTLCKVIASTNVKKPFAEKT